VHRDRLSSQVAQITGGETITYQGGGHWSERKWRRGLLSILKPRS